MKNTQFWKKWSGISSRCNKSSKSENRSLKYYRDKGIIVEKRWEQFSNFFEDMYDSYAEHVKEFGEKNTTIDRINSSGNYCKENCRWATIKEQNNNKSDNRRLEYKGVIKTMTEWAKEKNLSVQCLKRRLDNYGWTIEQAIEGKKRQRFKKELSFMKPIRAIKGGKEVLRYSSIIEAAKELNVVPSAIGNCLSGRSKSSKGYVWKFT